MHTIRRRHPAAQGAIILTALSAMLAATMSLLAAPATAGNDSIKVLSIHEFGPDSIGYREIVGEVQNVGSSAVGAIRIDFNFYSADNRLLSTDYTYASVDRLAPGERSPFSLSFEPVAGYNHFSHVVSDAQHTWRALNHNFTVTVTNAYNDGMWDRVVGTVRNDNTTTATFVSVVGTAYSPDGAALDATEAFINNNSKELAAGTSATFELIFWGGRPFVRHALLAQASSAPSSSSPEASPSPSVPSSSATPTPTANKVPWVAVNPYVVKFGQTANVTINGTPGATVDLYIRKYRGDFIKIRDGLILDSGGRVTVPTRPDMNLRFMAKDRTVDQGSGVGGSEGLMTVEKYVSINVNRLGVNRYTFSGSINPSHQGAVVHLYRNGSLIRSNIPVNGSRVYSWTGALPPGQANYRISSPVTGYNNLSHSPTRSVNIY